MHFFYRYIFWYLIAVRTFIHICTAYNFIIIHTSTSAILISLILLQLSILILFTFLQPMGLYHSHSFKKLPVMHLLQWNSKCISSPICSISFKLKYSISSVLSLKSFIYTLPSITGHTSQAHNKKYKIIIFNNIRIGDNSFLHKWQVFL